MPPSVPSELAPERLLFGVPFAAVTLAEAVRRCTDAVAAGRPLTIGVANAAKLVRMRSDAALRDSVLRCDLILADGMSVVWASRLLRRALPERVTGIDLFHELLARAEGDGRSVYLLGAREEVLAKLRGRLAELHPRLAVAGARDGYFGAQAEQRVAEEVRRSGADYLFIGISSPKKERFLDAWGPRLGARVRHGVGGSFDVLAGEVRRAPGWLQRAGLEWLHRLVQEPRRLWRRYLVTNTLFLCMLARELVAPAPRLRPAPRPSDGAASRADEPPAERPSGDASAAA